MKKNLILLILCAALFSGCVTVNPLIETGFNHALTFKAEHEELNGMPNPHNPALSFINMDVREDNPFKYAEWEEIIEKLEGGTGIIYLGFPNCPWCRNLVPVLTEAAMSLGITDILYRDTLADRNILTLSDGNITETRAGHPGYYRVLEILGDLAPAYAGLNDESFRRVYAPTVLFVGNGEVVGYLESLPTFMERAMQDELGAWQPMTDEEVAELREIIRNYIRSAYAVSPDDPHDNACPLC